MSHILIIDDDVHIGNMLEELLVREGCQVSRAYSGTEALLVLSAAKPDLVLRLRESAKGQVLNFRRYGNHGVFHPCRHGS